MAALEIWTWRKSTSVIREFQGAVTRMCSIVKAARPIAASVPIFHPTTSPPKKATTGATPGWIVELAHTLALSRQPGPGRRLRRTCTARGGQPVAPTPLRIPIFRVQLPHRSAGLLLRRSPEQGKFVDGPEERIQHPIPQVGVGVFYRLRTARLRRRIVFRFSVGTITMGLEVEVGAILGRIRQLGVQVSFPNLSRLVKVQLEVGAEVAVTRLRRAIFRGQVSRTVFPAWEGAAAMTPGATEAILVRATPSRTGTLGRTRGAMEGMRGVTRTAPVTPGTTPMAEASPTAEAIPTAQATPTAQAIPMAEAIPMVEAILAAEAIPQEVVPTACQAATELSLVEIPSVLRPLESTLRGGMDGQIKFLPAKRATTYASRPTSVDLDSPHSIQLKRKAQPLLLAFRVPFQALFLAGWFLAACRLSLISFLRSRRGTGRYPREAII